MDQLDFDIKPWDIKDPQTGKKGQVYVQDIHVLRKLYKLKKIFGKQKSPHQPHSNNWNFGSIPPHLLKKSS